MDEIRNNVPKTFRHLFVLALLAAFAAAGYTFLPEARVAAQSDTKSGATEQVEAPQVATQAMLDFALNLRGASEYTVYAERGIVDRGAEIRGAKNDATAVRATPVPRESGYARLRSPCW